MCGASLAGETSSEQLTSIHAAASDGNAASCGRDTACCREQAGALKRLEVVGGHWRPRAQQAAKPAFEIPLAVPAHIADPAMAANVAPRPFAGTAHTPGPADTPVLHRDLPRADTISMLRPRRTMRFQHVSRRKLGPLALPHRDRCGTAGDIRCSHPSVEVDPLTPRFRGAACGSVASRAPHRRSRRGRPSP